VPAALSAARSGQADLPTGTLLPHFVLAFGIAWSTFVAFYLAPDAIERLFGPPSGSHPLFILAVYAPAISALLLVGLHGGWGATGRFLGRLLLWRCGWGWVAFLLFGIPAIYWAGALVKGPAMPIVLPPGGAGAVLSALAFMAVLGPVEEVGWRGVALPLLQRRLAPVWAGMVLGLIWGIWHLPAFFLSGTPQSAWSLTPFVIGSIAVSVIVTPLFNRSGGSILLAALFHFQLNNPLSPDGQPYDTIFFVAAALLTVWLHRATMFTRDGAVTWVIAE
jgi:hypothetical protein